MNQLMIDLKSEIVTLFKGSTIDAIIPPFVYVILNQYFSISIAGISAVLIAMIFALFANRASDFFIPQLISSGVFILIMMISLFLKKPFAAWLSHISRGWTIEWFWRKDIKPAYMEVTIFWVIFATVKLGIQIYLWRNGPISTFFLINSLLGMPAITTVLIATYIYGVFRLKNLNGPSVDEFNQGKEAPWLGQRKGF